jgi:ubiquinone/menaquinone biosynthesis C-methylase UbiE
MAAFSHHHHDHGDHDHGEGASKETEGRMHNEGWRYDLNIWFTDTFIFRGKRRELQRRTIDLARMQAGEQVLDVGCGTGTLALALARRVGRTGHVAGIDPATEQIARARAKAARHHLPIDFQIGTIEQIPFSDVVFDVVFSTLMIHHVPDALKREGMTEVARVLKPGGRLVMADFTHGSERTGQATRSHAGGSHVQDLVALVSDAGFQDLETEEMRPQHPSAFPGASIVLAYKRADSHVGKEKG